MDKTRPVAVPLPDDGYYWVQIAMCGWRSGVGYDWAQPRSYSWIMCRVDQGDVDTIGSDEIFAWDSRYQVVIKVGSKIEPPPEQEG